MVSLAKPKWFSLDILALADPTLTVRQVKVQERYTLLRQRMSGEVG